MRRGRVVSDIHDLGPMSKRLYDELDTETTLREFAGQSEDQSSWGFIYGTVYFWVVAAIVAGLLIFLGESPALPAALRSDWAQPVFLIVGRAAAGAPAGQSKRRVQSAEFAV